MNKFLTQQLMRVRDPFVPPLDHRLYILSMSGCARSKCCSGETEVVGLDTPVQLPILCSLARAASETMHSEL